MRDRVQRTPYGCIVRIGICLPDEATFSLDECAAVLFRNIIANWQRPYGCTKVWGRVSQASGVLSKGCVCT